MFVVSAIGLLLSCSAPSLSPMETPRFEFLWRRPGQPGRVQDAPIIQGTVWTTKGVLNLENGLYSDPGIPERRSIGISGAFRNPNQKTITFRGKTLFLIWDTDKCRIAREKHHSKLYQFRPGTMDLLATVDHDLYEVEELTMSGDPDRGTLKIGSWLVGMSRELVFQNLYLTKPLLRVSPLRVVQSFDIRRPDQGILGVAFPPGTSEVGLRSVSYTPGSPLVLGNPFTGKILWANKSFGTGFWLGQHWVLAQRTRGSLAWNLLDARTGSNTGIEVPPQLDHAGGYAVQTVGSYVLVYDVDRNSTYAYRLAM